MIQSDLFLLYFSFHPLHNQNNNFFVDLYFLVSNEIHMMLFLSCVLFLKQHCHSITFLFSFHNTLYYQLTSQIFTIHNKDDFITISFNHPILLTSHHIFIFIFYIHTFIIQMHFSYQSFFSRLKFIAFFIQKRKCFIKHIPTLSNNFPIYQSSIFGKRVFFSDTIFPSHWPKSTGTNNCNHKIKIDNQ